MVAGAQTPRSTYTPARAREYHPAMWRRVRGACVWASSNFDLDQHAANIVAVVVSAQVRAQKGRR